MTSGRPTPSTNAGWAGSSGGRPESREWEVFNEPDSNYAAATDTTDCTHRNGVWVGSGTAYQCLLGSGAVTPSGGNGHGGSAQAAAYWYLDAKRVDHNPGHTLLAGGFNYSSSRCTPTTCYYLGGYFRVLSAIYPHPPDAIALNPYIDVSYAAINGGNPVPPASSGLPSAQGAITKIDTIYPSRPPIWFTEVGVWLTDGGKEPVTAGCGDGNLQDDGSWAACLNANPNAQALAAEGYLRLPEESDQVQRVYYYDFDGQNPGWDSGLVNLNPPLLGPHGDGVPRTTWCVLDDYLHGAPPDAASADALRSGSSCDFPAGRRGAGRRRRLPERPGIRCTFASRHARRGRTRFDAHRVRPDQGARLDPVVPRAALLTGSASRPPPAWRRGS